MQRRIGISTSCRSARTEDGAELLRLMEKIGFHSLELEYRITQRMFESMLPLLRRKPFEVLSVHNFFPHPSEFPRETAGGDLFNLASPDREERREAVRRTRAGMEISSDLEAPRFIVHGGYVQFLEHEPTFRVDLGAAGSVPRDPGEEMKVFLEKRGVQVPNFLDSLMFSLESLLRDAEKLGLELCLENRFHPREIPDSRELKHILDTFRGAPISFWLDTGHAAFQESIGVQPVEAWLDTALVHRTAGIHVHDFKPPSRDHLLPGEGSVDYVRFRPILEKAPVWIFEIGEGVETERIRTSIEYFQAETLKSG